MNGVTVTVDPDPDRDEPGRTYTDVVGYALVTAQGLLYARLVDDTATGVLAAGLRETARQIDAYAATGVWPDGPGVRQ